MTAIISCVQTQIYKLPYGHYRDIFLQIFYGLQIYNIYIQFKYIYNSIKKKKKQIKSTLFSNFKFHVVKQSSGGTDVM